MSEIFLTEDIIKELVNDNTVCVVVDGKHIWITLPDELESKVIDAVEQKWVKKYGLDGKEEG